MTCIDTYLPREGPERPNRDSHELRLLSCESIATYLPRKWPETLVVQEYELLSSLRVYPLIYLARGRKLTLLFMSVINGVCIDPYLLREGPETYTSLLQIIEIKV